MSASPDGDIQLTAISDFDVESLARCLLPKIQAFYDSPEGQAAFADWKQQQSE